MADIKLTSPGGNAFGGLASLPTGGHVTVWYGLSADGTEDIFQQRSDANGQPVGAIEVVNTQTVGRQANAVVGALANGGYVVAWSTQPPPSNGLRTHLQIFDSAGRAVGSEIEIPNATNTSPGDIIGLKDGGFILDYQDTSSEYLLSFSDTGQVLGKLGIGHSSSQARGTALSNGKFVVFDSLAGSIQQPDGATIVGQVYTVSGGVITPEGQGFTVNTPAALFGPRLMSHSEAALADGGFVIAWTATQADQTDIYVRRFSATGAPLTNDILVHAPSAEVQYGPQVVGLADGGWYAAWNTGSPQFPTDNTHGQRFDASGARVGPEISLTESPALGQGLRDMTLAGDGSLVLAWETGSFVNKTVEIYETHFNLVDGGAGADTLNGAAGDIRDMIYGAGGNDTLSGGAGADVIIGGDGDDTLAGGAGDDRLYGDAGNDRINGGDGDDLIEGGAGDDSLDGGAGIDTVSYASASRGVNVDLVSILQNPFGSERDALFNFENLTGSAFNDRLQGDFGPNTLSGGAGDDWLQGGNGDDLFIGGAGADAILGGEGYDTASYADSTSGVSVNLSVKFGEPVITSEGDTLSDIENLIGSIYADTFTGAANQNTFDGGKGDDFLAGMNGDDVLKGGAGNDVLQGGEQNDYLDGGAGDDSLDGGGGVDIASYESATSGVTVSLAVSGSQSTGGAGTDTLVNFENLVGSAFADVLTGDEQNNSIAGGAGDDRLDGGAGVDAAIYDSATSGVTVSLAVTGAQNTGGGGTDTLVNFETLVGSAFDDVLTGDERNNLLIGAAGADVLVGGQGDDTLVGGAGDDRLDGGAGIDTVSYAAATGGVTVTLNGQSAGADGADTLISIEILFGSAFADALTGDADANLLIGLGGNDTLDGGAGADRLYGGAGDDIYKVDTQADLTFELVGEGNDAVVSTANFYLYDNLETLTLAAARATSSAWATAWPIASTATRAITSSSAAPATTPSSAGPGTIACSAKTGSMSSMATRATICSRAARATTP